MATLTIRLTDELREDNWEAYLLKVADEPVMLEAVGTWCNPLERRPACLGKRG